VVDQLALAALPTNFPAFVADQPENKERVAFLAGETGSVAQTWWM